MLQCEICGERKKMYRFYRKFLCKECYIEFIKNRITCLTETCSAGFLVKNHCCGDRCKGFFKLGKYGDEYLCNNCLSLC
jgi:hypothetical protein